MDRQSHPPKTSSTVLLVGTEQMLLFTRRAILEKRNFTVSIANPADAVPLLAQQNFDVVVACHTLAPEETDAVAQAAKSKAKVPGLIRYTKQPFAHGKLGPYDAAVWSLSEPESLLTHVFAVLPPS